MEPYCRIFVLFLMAGVFGGSAVPPDDLPDTAFDESDTPLNVVLPSQATLGFVRPVNRSNTMLGQRFDRAASILSDRVPEATAMPSQRHPDSLQELLSTFRI